MPSYRTISVQVDAIQWFRGENDREVFAFVNKTFPEEADYIGVITFMGSYTRCVIEPGMWVVRHPDLGLIAYSNSVFHSLYEKEAA